MSCEKLNCNNPKIPRGKYCENHRSKKKSGKRPTCQSVGCNTRPSFGKAGSDKREYCSKHKPKDYVDLVHNTCKEVDCNTRPSFGSIL